MKVIIGVLVIAMLGIVFIFIGCSDETETAKTEKQMIMQETESTNKKLSNQ